MLSFNLTRILAGYLQDTILQNAVNVEDDLYKQAAVIMLRLVYNVVGSTLLSIVLIGFGITECVRQWNMYLRHSIAVTDMETSSIQSDDDDVNDTTQYCSLTSCSQTSKSVNFHFGAVLQCMLCIIAIIYDLLSLEFGYNAESSSYSIIKTISCHVPIYVMLNVSSIVDTLLMRGVHFVVPYIDHLCQLFLLLSVLICLQYRDNPAEATIHERVFYTINCFISITVLLAAAALLGQLLYPSNILISQIRGYSTILMGSWCFHSGVILFTDFSTYPAVVLLQNQPGTRLSGRTIASVNELVMHVSGHFCLHLLLVFVVVCAIGCVMELVMTVPCGHSIQLDNLQSVVGPIDDVDNYFSDDIVN